jgi:hypothetical protein
MGAILGLVSSPVCCVIQFFSQGPEAIGLRLLLGVYVARLVVLTR